MPTPTNIDEFLDLVQRSGVVEERRLTGYLDRLRATSSLPAEPNQLAAIMVRDGLLTYFQADQLLQGKWKRFTIGRYKVLERLGAGGMGSVYLCEHKLMRRRVAVKVLPAAKADDPSSLERFYREARAVAALDHPNIVRAYDIDQDEKLHFLVMEYVDGASLQDILKRSGPLDVLRTCNYMRQAALGLQHAHEKAGLVHRDIKPGNILVDRGGIVKILDMGLARFFHDEEDMLTKKYDENVLGTADYLAPEQALDSHAVDIRADIYSLGATFYFCLTSKTPFAEGTVAQKLIWHQTRQPKPIRTFRPDVPDEVLAIIDRMMAKDPGQRYASPQGIVDALAIWTQTPVPPPPDSEMPRLSPAALGIAPSDPTVAAARAAETPNRGGWQVNVSSTSLGPGVPVAPTIVKPGTPPGGVPPPAPLSPAAVSQARPLAAPVAKVLSGLPSTTTAPLRQATAPPPSSTTARPIAPPAKSSAATAPVPAPAPAPADEEEPNWGNITPDTDDPKGSNKTQNLSRSSLGKPRSGTRSGKSNKNLAKPVRLRLWIIAGVSTFLVLLALGIGYWLSTGPFRALVETPPPAPAKKPLEVTDQEIAGTYRTLQLAINNAGPNDRIVVKRHLFEVVSLKDKQNLIIETDGRVLTWGPPKGPANAPPPPRLLTIETCSDVVIRGFKLDGDKNGIRDCIMIWGKCPGVSLKELQLANFTRCGVHIANCEGSDENPVTLSDLKFIPKGNSPPPIGILFDLGNAPIRVNRYFTIQNIEFTPPVNTGVLIAKKKLVPSVAVGGILKPKGVEIEERDAP